jgi:hypothetical protein
MRDDDCAQLTLFDLGVRPDTETSAERARRRNRERQRAWRRRHQFVAPLIESPTGATFTTCRA